VKPEQIKAYWPWFFGAAALEAGAAVLALARIPSEGLSLARLALFAVLLAFTLTGLYLAFRPPRILDRLARPGPILAAALLALALGLLLFLLRYLDPERLLPVYQRSSPLLIFLLLLSLQSSLFLLALSRGIFPAALGANKATYFSALIAFLFSLLIFLLISLTRLGLTPDAAYWGEPGVPIQGWQFVLALLAGLATFIYGSRRHSSRLANYALRFLSPSFLLPILLYALAAVIWLNVPLDVLKNSFYVSMDPPTYQPFPYSDAGYYDTMAQSLFYGHAYRGEIPTRPLYIVFLAFLHLLFGQRYDLIIAGQTLALAFIPVVLYLLGEKIHSRAAGVTASLFFIFREWTTLLISSETRVSNTKTLLVDLPTLLLVLLTCLFTLRWLERRDSRSALIAGGSFGLLLLLRTQSLLLLPIMLAAAALVFGLRNRSFFLLSAFFLLGLAITIAPWLLHNYLQTGQVAFDAAFQYKMMATQYAYTGNLDIDNFDFGGKSLSQILLQFILKDPGFVFGFIANHFLAGWVGGLLALPLFQPYNGIFAPVNLYWMNWNGNLARYNVVLLLLYLAVISLGLGASWRRWRWMGLLPLAFSTGYSLATAVVRFSGWRYDLPADWVPYFYFAVGFAEILSLLALLFESDALDAESQSRRDSSSLPAGSMAPAISIRRLLPGALLFVLLGSLPWIATAFGSPRYTDQSPAALTLKTSKVSGAPAPADIQGFLAQPNAVLVEGQLLYPRYFYRGIGMSSANSWPSYATRDFPREGFLLVNQGLTHALFPTREALDFPQAADALLLGCRRDGYVEARLLAFPTSDLAYLSAPLTQPCD
jgi:hypothetical protein